MPEQKLAFQAEVAKLLHIVAHSLYSRKEVFLRELIANAADACDRARYESLTKPEILADDSDFAVTLRVDEAAGTLTVADNGIGMTRQELIDNLGTIAKSGTAKFVEQLSGDAAKDVSLIGQFGVGFYSAFIVADTVDVISRRAGSGEVWRWTSDGQGEFTVAESARDGRGTSVILHLKPDQKEFLEPGTLRQVVKAHADHIGIPVRLAGTETETLNAASALWTRARKDVTDEQYAEFYRGISHGFDAPWSTLHVRGEGRLEYTALLFVPGTRPLDLFHPDRKSSVRLYVRRVFVTDTVTGLVPGYLRFLRGVVDTEDVSLNVSREMLQQEPVLAKIGTALGRKVLTELAKKAEKEPEEYAKFWDNFGAVLKEGIYEDAERRDEIQKLARFRSTASDGWNSLAEYVGRMKPGQDAIYYASGDDLARLRTSPQLEGFRARGVEVLLMTDAVDEFWIPAAGTFDGKKLVSVTRGTADLSKVAAPETPKDTVEAPPAADVAVLVALLKQSLGDHVKVVRVSDRLVDSPVCLVADESDPDRHLARLLQAHGQLKSPVVGVLEINPRHALIRSLVALAKQPGNPDRLNDAAWLLLDQARILDGEAPIDPAAFARRLASVMTASAKTA